jgi:hypothetical protein
VNILKAIVVIAALSGAVFSLYQAYHEKDDKNV